MAIRFAGARRRSAPPSAARRSAKPAVKRRERLQRRIGFSGIRYQRVVVVTAHVSARDGLHHNAIAARYDIHIAIVQRIIEPGLRNQMRNLTAHWNDALVT